MEIRSPDSGATFSRTHSIVYSRCGIYNGNIPHREYILWHGVLVQGKLDEKVGVFLRAKRGSMTYADFARRVGITPSTLFRLEQGQQSITLRSLEKILERLKCDVVDIFLHAPVARVAENHKDSVKKSTGSKSAANRVRYKK